MGNCCGDICPQDGLPDLLYKSNRDLRIRVAVTDCETGEPKDITGATAIDYALARTQFDSDDILIQKALPVGIFIVPFDPVENPGNNLYEIIIDAADTADLNGNYYHVSTLTDVAGNRSDIFCSDNVQFTKSLI